MKKIILLFVLTLSTASFAQLKKIDAKALESEEIGKIQPFGLPLQIEATKFKNVYTIRYRDVEYTTLDSYKEFKFEDKDNTFEDLYNAIIEGFEKTPKESVMLSLPDYTISLRFDKALGMQTVTFFSAPAMQADAISRSASFTRKQIDKLFGKKK
jgi:hypothetical protein